VLSLSLTTNIVVIVIFVYKFSELTWVCPVFIISVVNDREFKFKIIYLSSCLPEIVVRLCDTKGEIRAAYSALLELIPTYIITR